MRFVLGFLVFSLLFSFQAAAMEVRGEGVEALLGYDEYRVGEEREEGGFLNYADYTAGEERESMREESLLSYDYYKNSCPQAESIIRDTVSELTRNRSNVPAVLLRLAFHDCFVEGCEASVLLDEVVDGGPSEKEARPNKGSLKGFDLIDMIKSNLQNSCPATVSCADIIVLSARDAIALAGGPFYPLKMGRKDGFKSHFERAEAELPRPSDHLNTTLSRFMAKGFSLIDTISLLGGHSIGKTSCRFINDRLFNMSGGGLPDPTLPLDLLPSLRIACDPANGISHAATGISDPQVPLHLEATNNQAFDATHFYANLAWGRGVLFSDQQLMSSPITAAIVRQYASGERSFDSDFGAAMIKLSNLGLLSGGAGEVRTHCAYFNI
ncbi:peroxidase 28 [Amborella trichopoda]|nr:peroxidase 28 [Amborella trichopoda]|eukprot:XP_006858291.3 peroxidase 28 [Amborella trichopoda]